VPIQCSGCKVSEQSALGFDVAALASAFNGVIGNPLFTALFATEYQVGGQSGLVYLVWNLLAGAIGFSVYTILGLASFTKFVAFTPVSALEWQYLAYAVLLGVAGLVTSVAGTPFSSSTPSTPMPGQTKPALDGSSMHQPSSRPAKPCH
jgi:hypothetical protein